MAATSGWTKRSKHAARGAKIVYAPDTALDYLIEFSFAGTYEGQAKRGWLYYDEAEDVYRFTIKGAYLTTWGLLQPIKAIRLAMLHQRARSVLQEFRQYVQWTPATGDDDVES